MIEIPSKCASSFFTWNQCNNGLGYNFTRFLDFFLYQFGIEFFLFFYFRQLLNNSKHNVRKDKKLQVWANLKRCATDATLYWAAKKLKSWGALEKVDDCFVSGTVLQNYSLPSFLILQGLPCRYYFPKVNGCSSEMVQIWPHVGKIKMCMTGGNSFENCKQITEKCKQSFENWKNLPLLKHILALPTWGQIWMNTISAIYFWKIVYGTPCISHQYFREIHSLIFTFEYCPSEASSATQFWAISELKNSNFRNFNFFHDSLTYILCEF